MYVYVYTLYCPNTVLFPEEANVQEALCLVSSHAKTIFDELNNDPEFYACLVFCLLELVLSDERSEEVVLKVCASVCE